MDCRPTICGVLPGVGYFAGYMQTPIWNRVINCDVLARTLLFPRKRRLVADLRRAIMVFAFLVRMPLLKLLLLRMRGLDQSMESACTLLIFLRLT